MFDRIWKAFADENNIGKTVILGTCLCIPLLLWMFVVSVLFFSGDFDFEFTVQENREAARKIFTILIIAYALLWVDERLRGRKRK